MKSILVTLILFSALCGKAQETQDTSLSGCSECTCPSWRSDSGNPDKCINIRPPSQILCNHLKEFHSSSVKDGLQFSLLVNGTNELQNYYLKESKEVIGKNDVLEKSFLNSADLIENQQTMYCLKWVREENGYYNGKSARFSVWEPKTGLACCVIVNISRGGKIIARQSVSVTKSKMLRVLIGEVNGVSQGVSPCR